MSTPLTLVTFISDAFNQDEPKEYFINSCCFGDDVCRWLIRELKKQGIPVEEEPGQEDCGWYLTFTPEKVPHTFFVTTDTERWIGHLERDCGFMLSLLGRRNKGITGKAASVIDGILKKNPEIEKVEWHNRHAFVYNRPHAAASSPV